MTTDLSQLRDYNDSELLEALIAADVVSQTAGGRAMQASARSRTSLERSILELGLASEEELYNAISDFLDIPLTPLAKVDAPLVKSLELERSFLERIEAVPVKEAADGSFWIATSNPRARDALRSVEFHLGTKIRPTFATRSAVKSALGLIFDEADGDITASSEKDIERLQALANEGPVIGQVNDLIAKAVAARASDIHIEAMEANARVRFRIDGDLQIHRAVSHQDCAMYVSRLKIMGRLNISEKRRPQDGRAQVSIQGRNVDLRMSTLPTQYGESVVIRILDQSRMDLSWDALGYPAARVAEIEQIIRQPNGIFLVTGPTGSGKTTTLYTALKQINSDNRKIITVEDPIEYAMEGISQVQVQPEIEMSFARALRAILRQDPDVVLIGEIRDEETAEIAVRAAMVGRLVLSTLHTNDAPSAINRMLDLGVPEYLLKDTLRGVLAQRLVKRPCGACGGQGCAHCNQTGFDGRMVESELMKANFLSEPARLRTA